MMGFLSRKSIGPIGLDLGARWIKACQLDRSGATDRLAASASIPRVGTGAAGEMRRVRDILDRRGFHGNQVVIAAPNHRLRSATLELPVRAPNTPLDQIAHAEFCRTQKIEPATIEFAWWELPSPARANRATHAVGVACAVADADPILDALDAAEFDVLAVDLESAALLRAVPHAELSPAEITPIIDIGHSATRLLIAHQSVVSYQRSLDESGVAKLAESIQTQLELDDQTAQYSLFTAGVSGDVIGGEGEILERSRELIRGYCDSLIGEMLTSLSYAGHQYPDAATKKLFVAGGGTLIPGVVEYIKALVQSEVVSLDAAGAVDASLALAYGLARYREGGAA